MHLSPSQKSLIKSQAGRPPGNREVTFDERGNVIGVMKLNVQTLPTHRVRNFFTLIYLLVLTFVELHRTKNL